MKVKHEKSAGMNSPPAPTYLVHLRTQIGHIPTTETLINYERDIKHRVARSAEPHYESTCV